MRRLRVVLCSLCLFATRAVAIDVPPPPAPAAPDAVSIGWMVYVPEVITVKPGTTVTWTNVDDSSHDVQFKDQKSPRLNKYETYHRTFDKAGEYPYICSIHGVHMKGTVVVR